MNLRQRVALAVTAVGLLISAPAGATPVGGTVLVDRPSGFGALPFDGIGYSSISARPITPDGRYVIFSSQSDVR